MSRKSETNTHRTNCHIPKAAAAVVTYNKQEAVLKLIGLLEKLRIPTFVTENACVDGTRKSILERFPHVSLLESPNNLGGCGGFNCAVLAALSSGSKYIILLDDDVLPEPDCIEKMADFLDTHEDYAFVAPAIYITSKPDTLQETGGGADFSRELPIEAWNRFSVNPDLPEYMDVDYASACCLMVRSEAIYKTGIMDWNFFIFSDDVDWTIRLRKAYGKGACLTTARTLHDFPWAKSFSPMRLYYFHRNLLYLISKHQQGKSTLISLKATLKQLFRKLIYSFVIGDYEVRKTLWDAFSDALHGRYGKWQHPFQFDTNRKKLDSHYFGVRKIRRVLLDITIEDIDNQALHTIRDCAGDDVVVDILCDAHRVQIYRDKGVFSTVYGRTTGRFNQLKTFLVIKCKKKYDLIVTDTSMEPRRLSSMSGKRAAFFHDGNLYEAANRPLRACIAHIVSRFIGVGLAWLSYQRFLERPIPGTPPEEASPLLEHIGFDPSVGQPWAKCWEKPLSPISQNYHGAAGMNAKKKYTPPISPPLLGAGEDSGGYNVWCQTRDLQAPHKYTIQHCNKVPLFSVLVPVYDPQPEWLQECIDSVRSQTYSGWELIMVDDASQNTAIRTILKTAAQNDKRIKVDYNDTRSGISTTTNRAASHAVGDYLVFLDHDDLLDTYALAAFAQTLRDEGQNGNIDVLYADEDRFDETRKRMHPGFKSEYSPDRLLTTNYIHHPVTIRRDLFEQLGGLRSQFDGSQDHDLLLRAVEICNRVVHIPDVLYHMRLHSGSLAANPNSKPKAHEIDREAIAETLKRRGITGEVMPAPEGVPGYSVVRRKMPENVSISMLILAENIIDATEISELSESYQCVISFDSNLTIPERLNALARKATGDILIIASSQLHLKSGWREAIIPHLIRPEIGLVTGKLVYRSNFLHSCGLVLGVAGVTGRWHYGCNASEPGYGGWMVLDHEVSAVPWQFMGVRRSLLLDNGLFDTAFVQHGFDIDLALRLQEQANLHHLAIPGAKAVFNQDYPEYQLEKWNIEDFKLLWKRWGHIIRKGDPYLNPNLSLYNEGIKLIDQEENDMRTRNTFMPHDDFGIEQFAQKFPGRIK
jgi:GT2 family glycosyltransferase